MHDVNALQRPRPNCKPANSYHSTCRHTCEVKLEPKKLGNQDAWTGPFDAETGHRERIAGPMDAGEQVIGRVLQDQLMQENRSLEECCTLTGRPLEFGSSLAHNTGCAGWLTGCS